MFETFIIFWAFFGWLKFVSACVKRNKKKLKNPIFALTPLRIWSKFRRSPVEASK